MGQKFDFIDLFAGIGGMRLAFERAGGRCVFSSEWDKYSRKTYEANFGEIPHGDITQISETQIPKFDVLSAGFPCQPFSSIGKRQGFKHPTQGTLFHEIVRIVEDRNSHRRKRVKALLLENVAGLLTHDNGRTMAVIEGELTRLGYEYDYRILDAADYGVPQYRQRIYIVGYYVGPKSARRTDLEWPDPSGTLEPIGKHVEKQVKGYSITKHLQSVYIHKEQDGRPQIIDQNSDFPVKTLVASYHKIQRLTGTFVADGETGLRLLTPNECKAIMGFPPNFQLPVSRTQMYRQMGNSVAVPVVSEIASKISEELSERFEL